MKCICCGKFIIHFIYNENQLMIVPICIKERFCTMVTDSIHVFARANSYHAWRFFAYPHVLPIVIRTINFKHNREWLLFYGPCFTSLKNQVFQSNVKDRDLENNNWSSFIVCFIHPSRQTNLFWWMSDFTKG